MICHNFRTIQLKKGQTTTIGREKYNDMVLNDLLVSRQHAMVYYEENEFWVKDLNSRNGTYLNDEPIEKARLKDGDVIKIGNYEFSIRAASAMDVERLLLKEKGRIASHETIVDADLGVQFSDTGFSGDLATLALVEVVQTLSQCLKRGRLKIVKEKKGDLIGEMYFDDGEITHAKYKSEVGFKAITGLMNLSEGKFIFENDVVSSERTVNQPTISILLEACRLKDESQRQETHS